MTEELYTKNQNSSDLGAGVNVHPNNTDSKARKKATNDEINERRLKLANIIARMKNEGKNPKTKTIITLMKNSGYPDYTVDEFYHDQKSLNRSNTFLRDLTESNYSKIVEDMWDDINKVVDKSRIMIDKANTDEKRRAACRLLLETVDIRNKILAGNVVDVSIQLLSNKLDRLEAENRRLELENEELKHELHKSN